MTDLFRTIRSGKRINITMPDSAAGYTLSDTDTSQGMILVVSGTLTAARPLYIAHSTLVYEVLVETSGHGIVIKGAATETGLSLGVSDTAHIFSDGSDWKASSSGTTASIDIASYPHKSLPASGDLFLLASVADSNALRYCTRAELMAAAGLTMGGDVTGTITSSTVVSIQGFPVASTTPTTGQVLTFDGSGWVPAAASTTGAVLQNGSRPLTAAWDVGGYNLSNLTVDGVDVDVTMAASKSFSGFTVAQQAVALTITPGTRTVALAAGTHYRNGKLITRAASISQTWPDVTGTYLFYVTDNTSTLYVESTPANFSSIIDRTNGTPVAIVYWSSLYGGKMLWDNDERHNLLQGDVHKILHSTVGARLSAGGTMSGFSIGNGSSNAHAQCTVDAYTCYDEDKFNSATASSQFAVWYSVGPSGNFDLYGSSTRAYPIGDPSGGFGSTTTRIQYNQYTGSTWQLTEVPSNNDHVMVHIFASPGITYKTISILGINYYASVGLAETGQAAEIASIRSRLGGIYGEFVHIGSIIYQTSTAYGNDVNARVVQTTNGQNYLPAIAAGGAVISGAALPTYQVDLSVNTLSPVVDVEYLPARTLPNQQGINVNGSLTYWVTAGTTTNYIKLCTISADDEIVIGKINIAVRDSGASVDVRYWSLMFTARRVSGVMSVESYYMLSNVTARSGDSVFTVPVFTVSTVNFDVYIEAVITSPASSHQFIYDISFNKTKVLYP